MWTGGAHEARIRTLMIFWRFLHVSSSASIVNQVYGLGPTLNPLICWSRAANASKSAWAEVRDAWKRGTTHEIIIWLRYYLKKSQTQPVTTRIPHKIDLKIKIENSRDLSKKDRLNNLLDSPEIGNVLLGERGFPRWNCNAQDPWDPLPRFRTRNWRRTLFWQRSDKGLRSAWTAPASWEGGSCEPPNRREASATWEEKQIHRIDGPSPGIRRAE